MRPETLRALRALPRKRPPTPWLLVAIDWTIEQIGRAPRPVQIPLLYTVLIASELLPVKILLLQETLYDRLYPESVRS
ncbi:MAG TPA: hypothetical protein VJM46_00620 [Candidatus Saccharimonadales bacterium]|nr:hypothetical protein [Candidatus Saccharimonadales bacterium]